MTAAPKPGDPASALELKYDAWNGLVEVSGGGIPAVHQLAGV